MIVGGALVVAAVLAMSSVSAQQKPAPKPPQPARLSDGQPDIQGLWSGGTGMHSLNVEPFTHLMKLGAPPFRANLGSRTIVVDPPDGIIPHQPWALERRNKAMVEYLAPSPAMMDTQTRGWPSGIPRENIYSTLDGSIGGPIQIMQPPGYVVFLFETHHEFRIVPLAGRPQPGQDIKLWMGSSRGRWEGNTLVIDVANNSDSPRIDVVGNFRSDEMRVTELVQFK